MSRRLQVKDSTYMTILTALKMARRAAESEGSDQVVDEVDLALADLGYFKALATTAAATPDTEETP